MGASASATLSLMTVLNTLSQKDSLMSCDTFFVQCLALVELGYDDAAYIQVRVQAFPDNLDHICNLSHSTHGKELCLNRDNEVVGRSKGVQRKQSQ